MEAMLLHFEDEAPEARRLAQAAGLARAQISRCASTKNELGLDLPPVLPRQVALYRNFANATDAGAASHSQYLLELLLFERLASRQGVSHLMLVAPYLGKGLSQDRDSIRVQALEGFLAGLFDVVLTVDPALSAVSSLGERLPLHHALLPDGSSGGRDDWSSGRGEEGDPQLLSRLGLALRNLYPH